MKKGQKAWICVLCFLHTFTILLCKGEFWKGGRGGCSNWGGEGAHRCKYPSGNNKNSFKWAMSPSSMYWLDLTRVETCVDHIYGINKQLKDLSFFWSILFVAGPSPPPPGPSPKAAMTIAFILYHHRSRWQNPFVIFISPVNMQLTCSTVVNLIPVLRQGQARNGRAFVPFVKYDTLPTLTVS